MSWIKILADLAKQCVAICKQVEAANPIDTKLQSAKATLKDHFKSSNNAEVATIRTEWKTLKKEADIRENETFDKLISFIEKVHTKAEQELDAKKYQLLVTIKKCATLLDYKNVLKQYTSKFEEVTAYLQQFHREVVDQMIKNLRKQVEGTKDEESTTVTSLVNIGKQLIAIQDTIKQYLGTKYDQALSLSGGADANSIVAQFPICAAYLRIMMSFAGISSSDDKKETPVDKEYIKYFGTGFLAKAVYNAVVPKTEKKA